MTEVEQMIEDCIKRESKLDDWEKGFVWSLRKASHNLTQMQLAKLEDIWERVT